MFNRVLEELDEIISRVQRIIDLTKQSEPVSRHTQTQLDLIENYEPLQIYYVPFNYYIEEHDKNYECTICFENKYKLNLIVELVRSRIPPPFDAYLCKQKLLEFTNKYPHEAWTIKEINQLSLDNLEPEWFDNEKIPDDLLITFTCGQHSICIGCLRQILTDYSNHPIDHSQSHMVCMYPFEDCKATLPHHLVSKILSDDQFKKYMEHADRYEFPGFEKVKCPGKYWLTSSSTFVDCKSTILVDISQIKNGEIGDVVMHCDQNVLCYGNFCYYCKKSLSYFQEFCYDCKMKNENTNENSLNYFFNTPPDSNLLYKNSEITFEIATKQLMDLITDIHLFYICPICKIPMERTEKCNGVSHHDIERCYVCGRIGQPIRGLADHWNQHGIGGCYRFQSDYYITEKFDYQCLENLCHNHEIGNCKIPEHQPALIQIEIDRKRAFLLHAINSLLPELRFKVLDYLYLQVPECDQHLLPKRTTIELLVEHPNRYFDYNEEIVLKLIRLKNKIE